MIICFDPDSHQIYGIQNESIHILNAPPSYRDKALQALKSVQQITRLTDYTNPELDHYRRRKLPSYLLRPRMSRYIRYLSQSRMSSSLNITCLKVLASIQDFHPSLNGRLIKVEVGLLSSADQAINLIINQLVRQLEDKQFERQQYVLQVKGYREFIYGQESMINFSRVRTLLRDGLNLECFLLEANFSDEEFDYPPMCESAEQVNWQKVEQVPVLLWYPPFKLTVYSLELREIQPERAHRQSKSLRVTECLYSGECDFPLSFQIYGIDGILNLFESDFIKLGNNRATYNGCQQMPYVTKGSATQNENNQKLFKVQLADDGSGMIRNMQQVKNLAFGGVECRKAMEQFKMLYQLEFVPYLIQIETTIYLGTQAIAHVYSKKVPFSCSVRFNEIFKFESLKISQLPVEARIGINVITFADKLSQIIASTTFYLFDHQSRINQGLKSLNLWPFYKICPRMMCATEYKDYSNTDQKFGFITIGLQKFDMPMVWSLRVAKSQKEIGFPEQITNLRFYSEIIQKDAKLEKLIEGSQQKQSRTSLLMLKQSVLSKVESLKRRGMNLELMRSLTQKSSFIKTIFGSYKKDYERLAVDYPYKNFDIIPKTEDLAYLQTLLALTPLQRGEINSQDKHILMICRRHYRTIPQALQMLLRAVNWADPIQVTEGQEMIRDWVPLPPDIAIPLLDAGFPHHAIRKYAVERISLLADDELALYMLQFQQALQFEKNHHSALGELLLERSCCSPLMVGHELFWLLKSSLHVKQSYERFAVILEQLLMVCGEFREHIVKEIMTNGVINEIALKVKAKPDMATRNEILRKSLQEVSDDQFKLKPFSIPLDSRMLVQDFVIDKCYALSSKKVPLKLCLSTGENSKQLQVIFKNGDDLKQDLLTIQMLRVLDKIWMDAGFDFKMKPYKVIATDDFVGLIEVVVDSKTISEIHVSSGKLGAFDETAIFTFLNQHSSNKEASKDCFLRSCAGYCVATYILGIGDRHVGNIMVTNQGNLFHIDFGHFLGNFKSKFGFKRERTKFVLSPEMVFVMDGKSSDTFKRFEDLCISAYNLARKNGPFLIDMFLMNLSAGIPELSQEADVKYLEDQLALKLSEQEATAKFRQEMNVAMSDMLRLFDNWIHSLVHKG